MKDAEKYLKLVYYHLADDKLLLSDENNAEFARQHIENDNFPLSRTW